MTLYDYEITSFPAFFGTAFMVSCAHCTYQTMSWKGQDAEGVLRDWLIHFQAVHRK